MELYRANLVGVRVSTEFGHNFPLWRETIMDKESHSQGAFATAWSDPASHAERFVDANGVRLHYLDWGGDGPALIFLHGITENPHLFDDFAPAFTDRFRVLAYARRGHGDSEAKGPYDGATLKQDLASFMDVLGIERAHLVGLSMGGNEITRMASEHPERVASLVYLDGGYDWSDFKSASAAMPPIILQLPSEATRSVEAYIAFRMAAQHPQITDQSRVEAFLRNEVDIQPDGSIKLRMEDEAREGCLHTFLNDRRDYTKVRAPALALYAETLYDLHVRDPERLEACRTWEKQYMAPFRSKSIDQIRRDLTGVEVVHVPGAHIDFYITHRVETLAEMRRFLLAQ